MEPAKFQEYLIWCSLQPREDNEFLKSNFLWVSFEKNGAKKWSFQPSCTHFWMKMSGCCHVSVDAKYIIQWNLVLLVCLIFPTCEETKAFSIPNQILQHFYQMLPEEQPLNSFFSPAFRQIRKLKVWFHIVLRRS